MKTDRLVGMKNSIARLNSLSRPALSAAVFLTCVVVYLSLFVTVHESKMASVSNSDEPHYLVATESILEDGDVTLSNNYSSKKYLDYFREEMKPHVTGGKNGRKVPWHQPFLSILVIPGYWIAGYSGAAVTMIVMTALAAAFLFLILDSLVRRIVALSVTLFAFLTYPLVSYSKLIFPETPALLLVVISIWATLKVREGRRIHILTSGICAAFLLQLHVKFAVLAFALLFLLAAVVGRRWRDYLLWGVPVAISIVAILAWTYHLFGPRIIHGLSVSAQGSFLGGNSFWGIPGLFLDRAWGLFPIAPVFLLSFYGMAVVSGLHKDKRLWFSAIAGVCAYVIFVGSFNTWYGGMAPVPRFLVPVLPVLIIFLSFFVESVRRWLAFLLVAFLGALNLVFTAFALSFPRGTYPSFGTTGLVQRYLGDSMVRLFNGVFPLFHPFGFKSGLLMALWLAVIGLTTHLARGYLGKSIHTSTLSISGDIDSREMSHGRQERRRRFASPKAGCLGFVSARFRAVQMVVRDYGGSEIDE